LNILSQLSKNKYNTSSHLLKTSLHYRVKHKSLKSVFVLQSCQLQVSTIKIFKHLKKHTTLLTYLLLCLATRVLMTSLGSWGKVWHFWHGLQQSAVDSAIDGERVFAPAMANGGHFELWQYDNRVSSHWSSETMF